MGRDQGYLAALLDPSRPSRARPTPDDLVALSDVTGIPLVELFEGLWAIPVGRFARELEQIDSATMSSGLSARDRRTVRDFAEFLAARKPSDSGQEIDR